MGEVKKEDFSKTTTQGLQRRVARTVEALTSEDGPLVALVAQVKESNVQAARAIRLMYIMLGAMLLQMVGMGLSAREVQDAANDLMKIAATQVDQQHATESLKEELEEQFNEVPRIVADEKTGQLKVVAHVIIEDVAVNVAPRKKSMGDAHTHDASLLVHPMHPEKRAPRKKSRRVEFLLDSFPMEAPVAAE